jgi:glycosyltransferase involved in cell wall biosynthesis
VTIAVIVASYGDDTWNELAWSRAYPSTLDQNADDVIVHHEPDGDIGTCRNNAAERTSTDHLIFLDADDELAPGYVDAMRNAVRDTPTLYAPRVSYVVRGRKQPPKYWPEKPLSEGNWLVIGTMLPRDVFVEVGGFDGRPHAFEDWALFARCWKAGAEPLKVPRAVYVAHWTPGSRNKKLSREQQVRLHYDLGRDIFPDQYPPSWLTQHLRNARR